MNRYEIAREAHKFDSCEEAFTSIGLEYLNSNYACYNEEIGDGEELCPFAANDTCQSKELPLVFQVHEDKSYSDKILNSLMGDCATDML